MKVLFDTSVLVAAMVEAHPKHRTAFLWLKKGCKDEIEFMVSAHSIAELYAVLTRLPVNPPIFPTTAYRLIRDNIGKHARIIPVDPEGYLHIIRDMAELNIRGGRIYDSLIAYAARSQGVDILLTYNAKDFLAVWPEGKETIRVPG